MPEIYGNAWSETARTKLGIRFVGLIIDMTGYSPTFVTYYDKHNVANLLLNAISVDLDNANADPVGANQYAARWTMQWSVRVHTAYADGITDGKTITRLLNSVAESLKANMDLADGYRIQEVRELVSRETFSESDTIGGSLICVVMKEIQYTQP